MEGIRRVTCTALSLFGLLVMPVATSSGDIVNDYMDGLGQFENAMASTNWAGYIVPTGVGHTSAASAGWTVPAASRHNGQAGDASSWVGIGGFSAHTLIQAGTQSDVDAAGNTTYFAWWEKVPDTQPARVVRLSVHPGDRMRVSLLETSPGLWRISIVNQSTEHRFSTTTSFASSKDSAEWIVERPVFVDAAGHHALTELPQLNQAGFDGARLNGANVKLPIMFQIHMLNNAHTGLEAFTSLPSTEGNSFAVCTYATSCAAPAPRHGEGQDNNDQQGDHQGDTQGDNQN
jgi:hypothetical protein